LTPSRESNGQVAQVEAASPLFGIIQAGFIPYGLQEPAWRPGSQIAVNVQDWLQSVVTGREALAKDHLMIMVLAWLLAGRKAYRANVELAVLTHGFVPSTDY
jgi:hypothetical protein